MEKLPTNKHQHLILMQLWGLDTPITTLCWAVACAALMQITMVTEGPKLLVAAGAWCWVMSGRLVAAIKSADAWQAAFYRSHMVLMIVLIFCVGMAALWMLFFEVGRHVLDYALIPGLLLILAQMCRGNVFHQTGVLLQNIAYAMFCALPAFYYSFSLSPLHLLTTAPVWYVGMLFFLWEREREILRNPITDARASLFNTGALVALLAASLISSVTAPMFERTLCITVAIGAGCLQALARLTPHLPKPLALAISWLTMALPALLGIILYAPESW